MKIKVVIHEAEEGGFWAEVPAVPGCATQGETVEELLKNVHEAVEGCLSVDVQQPKSTEKDRVLEISLWSRFPARILPAPLSAGGAYIPAGMCANFSTKSTRSFT